MKIVVLIARILLGLVFFVFGLNKFYPFIPS
jgi:putative oxidoreductase